MQLYKCWYIKRLTPNFIVNMHQMKSLAADGTTIGFSGPFPQTRIMEDMAANLDNSDFIIFVNSGRFRSYGSGGVVAANIISGVT